MRLRARQLARFDRMREVLSTYLPLLLMVLLALATWWLVKNSPQPQPPTPARVLTHEPDYRMRGVLLQRFDREGRLEITVEGHQMRHFPDTDTLEVDDVRVRAHGADGLLTTATARKALTDNATSELQLMGGAIVQREGRDDSPALRFESEFLHADVDRRTVKSHLPVKLRIGDSEIHAKGFRYDDERRVVALDGPLHTALSPENGKILSRTGERPPAAGKGTQAPRGGNR